MTTVVQPPGRPPVRPVGPRRSTPVGGRRAPARGLLLLPAAVAMLAGLDAALLLLELPAPVTADRLPEVHGVLLVLGFVGTLVTLERAVALGHRAGYAAPTLLGAGAVLLLSPAPPAVAGTSLALGAAGLVLLYVPLWRRQRDDAVLVQALGGVLGLGGALLWLGNTPVPVLLPWLVAFVVLTIVGERLELARLAFASSTPVLLLSCGLAAAVVATLLWPAVGYPLLGLALLSLVGLLATRDVARRTVRGAGLPRYMAWAMLAGYAWLAVAGATWLVGGVTVEGVRYDAVVHAVFLGFTVSMVMAHAPVILPAVVRRPLPYHPVLSVPLALLHVSLVLRLWVGDALGSHVAWQVGGLLNIVALLGFLGCAGWSSLSRGGSR